MKTYRVPKVFQPKVRAHFPPFQTGEELEWQAWKWFSREGVETSYSYLPVLWCPYYVTTAKYAQDERELKKLRSFVGMVKGKKFITTNIYDGWPIDTGNMVIFSGSGLPHHAVPIPLICDPHPGASREVTDRSILCSAAYSANTHPVRKELITFFEDYDDCQVIDTTRESDTTELMRRLMQLSTFALSPRGSGKTSFRMYEALQYNCIPVYVSDAHWLPFQSEIDWDKLAVIWPCYGYDDLYKKMVEIKSNGIDKKMREYGASIYDKYFTYEGCFSGMKRVIEKYYR